MGKNNKNFDFAGWATRFNIKCSDGRIIKPQAFEHCDGSTVPLVWNHNHNDADNVLGHAFLEKREEGIYAYGYFNSTEEGKRAKSLVEHKDITSLSIYANKLKQNGSEVVHGIIREVSLVLAGANPGAYIDTVMRHSDVDEEDAIISNPSEDLELNHTEEIENENQPNKGETKMAEKEKTVQEVFDELTDEQKNVVYALIGIALEEQEKENQGDKTQMKQNAFDKDNIEEDVLTHADFELIIKDAKKNGSVKEAFLAHNISGVDALFPEATAVNKTPATINDDQSWVQKVMGVVKKSPFSRIKSTIINITGDEARAKGYVKGAQKVEEVVSALKRTTTPTTVYKLQKMDRDDVVDINDFDVIAYLKSEMRGKLEEELARAVLVGDGRSADSDDKISPLNIRPILGDNPVYAVPKVMEKVANETDSVFAKRFIKEMIKSRKEYKGSGNPSLFTTEEMLTNMLLIEDTNGRVIYDTIEKLTTALRVKEIITVPAMENTLRTDELEAFDFAPIGILVNLTDYVMGADKGGAVSMFDDFDLNFNKYEYLIETRCSGALINPFSAITFELKTAHVAG